MLTEFVCALLTLLFFERVLHAITFFIIDTLLGSGEGALKRLASINSIQELFALGVELLYSVPSMIASVLQYFISRIFRIAAIAFLFVLCVMLYRGSPGLILDAVFMYNTRIAPVVRGFLLVPLQYSDLIFSPLVAAYNTLIYIAQGLIQHVFFPAVKSAPAPLLQIITAFADLLRELSLSFVVWWGSLYGDCSTTGVVSYILNATDSTEPRSLANATGNEINCYEPGMRSLNLMSPMAKMRVLVAHVGIFSKLSCSAASPVIDTLIYPFLDINLAKFVHNFLNAFLFWFVHTPIVTLERCAASREFDPVDSWYHGIMCLPDLYPGWNMLISSVRHLGILFDNWSNTLFIIVNTALGLPVPACVQANLELKTVTEESLFGGNESRFVGLTTGAFAITDGVSTQYNLFSGQITQQYAPNNWPIHIEQRLGVAAVIYDSDDEVDTGSLQQTMSMLGCKCDDVLDETAYKGSRMQITCAVARYNAELADMDVNTSSWQRNVENTVVPIEFALPSTAGYMTCAETKIVVDSVRWPVYRLSVPDEFVNWKSPLNEFVNDDGIDTPTEIDAVIWVIPACSTTGAAEPVCRKDFPDTACFPFCAAARQSGSRNNGMLLYSAADWSTHVQLLRRDCASQFPADSGDISYSTDASTLPKDYGGLIEQPRDFLVGTTRVSAWDPASQSCVYNDIVSSRLLSQTYTDSEMSAYGAVLLPEQPFAVAGDVVLTSLLDGNGQHVVKVQRMYGLEGSDAFTLVTVNSRLPANAPCFSPESCVQRDVVNPQHFTVPYSWFSTPLNHNPAVASKWGVFFAVNPSLRMFSEFFKFCDPATRTQSQLQYSVTTSYAPIRIWRVDAFAYHDPGGQEVDSSGAWVELEDPFLKVLDEYQCSQFFNVMVTSMEYLNDANIVVQVLYTRPSYYDTSSSSTWGNDPSEVQYRSYYLHPKRMVLRRFEMWVDEEAPALISQGMLCPSQRRMPEFGSMLAETTAAVLYVGRMVSEFFSVVAVVFQQGAYQDITTCLPLTRGHSFLRNCGQGFLDFDPFFLSIQRGNQLFWNSFSKVGAMVSGTPAGDNVQQFLNGVALSSQVQHYPLMVGRVRTFMTAASKINHGSIQQNMQSSFASVAGMPAKMRAMSSFSVAWVRSTRYFYKVLQRMLLGAVFNTRYRDGQSAAKSVVTTAWQAVYDSMNDYDSFVLDSQLQACVGTSLMFGYTNPWAGLLREQCQATAYFQRGVLNVLMVFFVDMPMMACLCVQGGTVNFRENALEQCWEVAPLQMRGLVRSIVVGSVETQNANDMCVRIADVVTDNMRSSMDPFIDVAYRATEHVADSIDYLIRLFEGRDTAQHCNLQFASNPYIVSIVPDPVDYWRVCGRTSICRSKCRSDIESFEALRDGRHLKVNSGSVSTGSTNVESQFFSDEDVVAGRSLSPFSILDIAELRDCAAVCGKDDYTSYHTSDRCISIVGISEQSTPAQVQVADYCIPASMENSVRQHSLWTVAGSEAWVGEIRMLKVLHQGRQFCHFFDVDGACSVVAVLVDRVSLFRQDGVAYDIMALGRLESQLQRVLDIFVFPGQSIVLHGSGLRKRDSVEAPFEVGYKSFCVSVSTEHAWGAYPVARCDAQNVINPFAPSRPSCIMSSASTTCTNILHIPTVESDSVRSCGVGNAFTGQVQIDASCVVLPQNGGAARAAGLINEMAVGGIVKREAWIKSPMHSKPVIASTIASLGVTSVHYGLMTANHPQKRTAWLSELRVSKSDGHTQNYASLQMSVFIEMHHSCSISNCMGCVGDVQRLCFVAQQCTILKCIGTSVNLQRPQCALGSILAEYMEGIIVTWHSQWNILVNYMVLFIEIPVRVGTNNIQGNTLDATAIDAAITNNVCEMKDLIISSCGLFTSLINTFVTQFAVRFEGPNAAALDEYADATDTMAMSSLTFFFSEIALGYVYPIIALQKMLQCQQTSLLAILDFTGLKIRIVSAEQAEMTDALAGTCLTDFYSEKSQQSADAEITFNGAVSSMMGQSLQFVVSLPFGQIKHQIDAGLAYIISIIRGTQDLITTADRKNCKLPDMSAKEVPTCACGDTAVKIPLDRASEGVQQSAFWCTGVLQMVSQFGLPKLVYNPYTYSQLVAAMATLDEYLACISTSSSHEDCVSLRPSLPVLEVQGVSTMSVFVRCKANYNNKQWDEAAAVFFAESIPVELSVVGTLLARDRALVDLTDSPLAVCMRTSLEMGTSSDGCLLDISLFSANLKRERYFGYEPLGANEVGSRHIAACEVFTGPSELGIEKFRDCMDGEGTDECFIQPFVWSGRSTNKVPVANAHAFMSSTREARAKIATATYRKVRESVLAALAKLGWDQASRTVSWEGDGVEVSLFTAEGDVLHQAFDCAILGPYGRAELWPADIESSLPTVSYYRDTAGGATREFELPCSGDALHGDGLGPFTCGSPARRSIIKYFLRNVTGIATGEGQNDGVKNAVVDAVRAKILQAAAVFASEAEYGCDCPASAPAVLHPKHVECCSLILNGFDPLSQSLSALPATTQRDLLHNFLPESIRDFVFAAVQEDISIDGLLDSIMHYTNNGLWRDAHDTMLQYNDEPTAHEWSEEQRTLAADEGLFSTTDDLKHYSAQEAAVPLHTTPFEMCMGLISQVLFTLPVKASDAYTSAADDFRDVPTTLDTVSSFDPMAESPDQHLSTLEHFVDQLVQDSVKRSPLHWSHWIRHMPSESLVCEEPGPFAVEEGSVFEVFDSAVYAALPLASVVVEHAPEALVLDGLYIDIPQEGVTAHTMFRSQSSTEASIGAIGRNCFCAWKHTDAAPNGRRHCQIPPSVCTARDWDSSGGVVGAQLALACRERSGLYDHAEYDHAIAVFMQSLWVTGSDMHCPLMAPSSAWGVANASQMDAWLAGAQNWTSVSSRDVASEGRSGVRMGNIVSMLNEYYLHFNPLQRAAHLYHETEANTRQGQKRCVSRNGTSVPPGNGSPGNGSPGNITEYARAWVDDLIPTVQGIEQQRAPSFCMRYVVELGLLSVYEHVLGPAAATTTEQAEVANSWKRRCKTQMKMLGFCSLRGVFAAAPLQAPASSNDGDSAASTSGECPVNITEIVTGPHAAGTRVEVASNCIVAVVHPEPNTEPNTETTPPVAFYDPCTCVQLDSIGEGGVKSVCALSENTPVTLQTLLTQCHALNALSLVGDTARLHTLHWSSLELDKSHWQRDGARTEQVEAAHARYHALNVLQDEESINALVDMKLEGIWDDFVVSSARRRNGTRASDPEATCGAISDWWPETWAYPVGYHPTVPCDGAAFRSFGNYEVYVEGLGMVYMHSALRDKWASRSESGTTGVCRAGSLAVRSRELNNARVCTRQLKNVRADYAVPVVEAVQNEEYFAQECSESPLDVPWDAGGSQDPALAASGLLSVWPKVAEDAAALWPPLAQQVGVLTVGLPEHLQSDTWSPPGDSGASACGMPPLLNCITDTDCTTRPAHESARSEGVVLKCLNNVCVVASAPAEAWNSEGAARFDCVEHSHCESGFLCSGEGRCVVPVVEFWNEREEASSASTRETIELEWHTKRGTCDPLNSHAVDTFGHSVWGDVDGVLQAHGLCSYRNWYEYNQMFRRQCGIPHSNDAGTWCELQRAGENVWPTTSRAEEGVGDETVSMFAQQRMLTHAHVCDRDYQHLAGFELCQPTFGALGATRVRFDSYAGEVVDLETYEYTLPGDYAKLLHTYYRSSAATSGSASLENLKLHLVQMQHMDNPQAGWLGTQHVFEDDGGGAEELGLTRCDQIPQCSLPTYTIQGQLVPVRRVGRGTGNAYSAYNYKVKDAIYCGAFGKQGATTSYQASPVEDFCTLDEAVLPVYQMLCQSSARNTLVANGCEFSKSIPAIEATCAVLGGQYTSQQRTSIQAQLNALLTDTFVTGFDSMTQYTQRMQCADAVWSQLQQRRDGAVDTAKLRQFIVYADNSDEDDSVVGTSLWSDSALYVFTEYSMVELPFMWWLKCHLLTGLVPTALEGQLQCDAWTNFREIPLENGALSMTTHEYLRTYAPRLPSNAVVAAQQRLQQEHLSSLDESVEKLRSKVTQLADGAEAYPDILPSCFMHQRFQNSEACVSTQETEGPSHRQFSRALYEISYNYGNINSVGPLRCCAAGTGADSCTPSGNNTVIQTTDILSAVHAFVEQQLQEEFLAVNSGLMQQPVVVVDSTDPVNGTLFPVFKHDWLLRDADTLLDTYVRGLYDDTLLDEGLSECTVVHVDSILDQATPDSEEAARCIFRDYEDDPAFQDSGFADNVLQHDIPYVVLSTYYTNTVNQLAGETRSMWSRHYNDDYSKVHSAINVCPAQEAVKYPDSASFLGQSCHLRGTQFQQHGAGGGGGAGSHENETFVCDDTDNPAFTCKKPGSGADAREITSPFSNFVCYDLENTCFASDFNVNGLKTPWTPKFPELQGSQWLRGWLPPGVQIVTYGYPVNESPLVGRNPLYQSPKEKLYWNGKFYDRKATDEALTKLSFLDDAMVAGVMRGMTK